MAVERGRGARRQRTLDIINRRIAPVLKDDKHEFEIKREYPYALWTHLYYLKCKGVRKHRAEMYPPDDQDYMTDYELGVLLRKYCKLEGRVGQAYRNNRGISCGDCFGVEHGGGCDWCSMRMRLSHKVEMKLSKEELAELGYLHTMGHPNRVYSPTKD